MNIFIKTLKIITTILLIGTLVLFMLGIIFPDVNEIVLFELVTFFCFIGCLYLFFVLSDIYKKKIHNLKCLNRIGLLVTFSLFIYWGIISPNAYGLAITTEIISFVLCNLIVITTLSFIIKNNRKNIFKEWKWFVLLMVCFLAWGIVNWNYKKTFF